MSKKHIFISVCLLFLLNTSKSSIFEEPYAAWSSLDGVDSNLKEFFEEGRNQNLPSKSEINVPRYPNSYLLKIDKYFCSFNYGNLILVSDSKMNEIIEWYGEKLKNFSKFVSNSRVFFIEGVTNFDYGKDSSILQNHQYVVIKKIDNTLRKIAPIYSVSIDVGFKTDGVKCANRDRR